MHNNALSNRPLLVRPRADNPGPSLTKISSGFTQRPLNLQISNHTWNSKNWFLPRIFPLEIPPRNGFCKGLNIQDIMVSQFKSTFLNQ